MLTKTTEIALDLSVYPDIITPQNNMRSISLGDIDGNALYLIHHLIAVNIISLEEKEYKKFVKI